MCHFSFTTTNWTAESQNFGTVVQMKWSLRAYVWRFYVKNKQPLSKGESHCQRNGIKSCKGSPPHSGSFSAVPCVVGSRAPGGTLCVPHPHSPGLSPPQACSLRRQLHQGTDPFSGVRDPGAPQGRTRDCRGNVLEVLP